MAADDKNAKPQPQSPPQQSTLPTTTAPLPRENPGDEKLPRARASSNVDMVKVTVKHTAPLGLPPMSRERAKQLGHELKADHLDRFLSPGENTIPSEHWNAVKNDTVVRNWIEEGWVYEGANRDAKPEPTGQTYRESLNTLSEDDAKRYVEASNDPGQLSRWADQERRPAVRDAIQRRMDAVGAGK